MALPASNFRRTGSSLQLLLGTEPYVYGKKHANQGGRRPAPEMGFVVVLTYKP